MNDTQAKAELKLSGERYTKEIYEGATEAMNGLFKVYLCSSDAELRAKCREMMDYFWAWKDKR